MNKMLLTDAWIVPYGKQEEKELKVHLDYLRKFEGTHVPPSDMKIRLRIKARTLGDVDAELAAVD